MLLAALSLGLPPFRDGSFEQGLVVARLPIRHLEGDEVDLPLLQLLQQGRSIRGNLHLQDNADALSKGFGKHVLSAHALAVILVVGVRPA